MESMQLESVSLFQVTTWGCFVAFLVSRHVTGVETLEHGLHGLHERCLGGQALEEEWYQRLLQGEIEVGSKGNDEKQKRHGILVILHCILNIDT